MRGLFHSIVTPSSSQAKFLAATLRSVASQDYERIEHIIMDGGSTDGSIEAIKQHARSHDVVWRSEPDEGQADAIQRGFEAAKGEIVGWLNSDDIYLDDHAIADVVAAFERGAQIVSGAGWYLNEAGHKVEHIPVKESWLEYSRLKCVDWVLQPATFFRRSLFMDLGFDAALSYTFDWDFFIRAARRAQIVPLHRDIAGYRVHGTGKTFSGGYRRYQELLHITGRYNGRRSPRFLLLAAATQYYRLGDHLPGMAGKAAHKSLHAFSKFTSKATDGRGIQF